MYTHLKGGKVKLHIDYHQGNLVMHNFSITEYGNEIMFEYDSIFELKGFFLNLVLQIACLIYICGISTRAF